MSAISEEFIRQYLRLNGYFCIDNFIVHAADDPRRITDNGEIGSYTETDLLGIRLPYSAEISGQLYMAHHISLVEGADGKTDIVIGEVKTGRENRPNRVWRHPEILYPKEYILKFVGLTNDDNEIKSIAKTLSEKYIYENEMTRIRYIIFSEEENKHYSDMGVSYITYDNIIDFLTEIRGQSWATAKIGVASLHHQWPVLLSEIFKIVNDFNIEIDERKRMIKEILNETSEKI